MVYVRVITLRDVLFGLLQSSTFATRYFVVRRQSPIEEDQPEASVLDKMKKKLKKINKSKLERD